MATDSDERVIVGSEEWCSFPELDIPWIKARVDSGAKTSALHAFNIQPFSKDGADWVSFEVHPLQNNRRTTVRCQAPVADHRAVKGTSGEAEKRFVVRTPVAVGDERWEIEVTLANRDTMGYRMLLGREAIVGRALVDPSASFCLGEVSDDHIADTYGTVTDGGTGLKIGVLASAPRLYSNRRLLEAGEERGHEMVFLNIRECYMRLDERTPEVHYGGATVLNDLDAVIPRVRPTLTFYGAALVRQFENLGLYSLNSAQAIGRAQDPLFALQVLLKSGIDIPRSGFANSPLETDDLIAMVGGPPLVVRQLSDTSRRKLMLADNEQIARSVINAMKSRDANLLVQEYIGEAEGRDLRLIVIEGRVVAAVERGAAAVPGKGVIERRGEIRKVKVSAAEKRLAIRATKTLGLRAAGVTLIRSKRGPPVLKVSVNPSLQPVEETTGKDLAAAMMRAVEKRLHWQPPKRSKAARS